MSEPMDAPARLAIRTAFDSTLFVEAGAGTGKTYALVTRVVHMVATGHLASMSQLCAITFTENAAAELRSRIREGLLEASEGAHAGLSYDAVQAGRALAGLHDLEDAVLTTLHGFAARILSESALQAGLPPGFAISEGRAGEEADRAWDDFIDELLEDRDLRGHIHAGLALDLNLRELRVIATALGSSWDRLIDRPLRHRDLPQLTLAGVLAHLRRAVADEGRWPADSLGAYLRELRELIDEWSELSDPIDILEALRSHRFKTGSRGSKPTWQKAGLDKEAIGLAVADADAARLALLQDAGAAVTSSLGARVQDWLLTQATRRRQDGALEYHDLLVLARNVLRADAGVRARLHAAWPTLLIDEFQDTDPLQVEIAYLLAAEAVDPLPHSWEDMQVSGSRLFFVGDAKQSIYRFRRADIDVFTAVGVHHRHAALRVNFRSVPGVLAAVNHAFDALIGQDPLAGIAYEHLESSRTEQGVRAPVLMLGGARELNAAGLRSAEAAHLADVAVRAKREQWELGGRPGDPVRVAQFRDMAILLPTRTSLPALEKALQARGVPYRIESRSLVWSTDAVRGVVAILAAVVNPADEVALLAALRNPGLACSDADLVNWRSLGGRWTLFGSIPEGASAEHPVAAALATLRAWHDARWWLPVNELVERVIRELRLVELTASQRRPRDHWRRLRFVTDQARAWCDGGGSGLGAFVAWALRQLEDDADVLETVVPEPDDDAVRILTVHGSKGLEFGITMVAGLGGNATRPTKVLWGAGGPELRLKADLLETAGWVAAEGPEKEQARREGVRLLYVALTRARDYLVLGCYHKAATTEFFTSPAQRLWALLDGSGHTVTELAFTPVPDGASEIASEEPVALADRDAFVAAREALLAAVADRVATSPTARTAAAEFSVPAESSAAEVPVDEADVEPDKPAAESAPDPDVAPARTRRSSRRGAAIGTATHRVLELAHLAQPGTEEIAALTAMACAAAQIPELAADVEARVWSALGADAVRGPLLAGARAHSEVYLVVPDGERFLEGYIDLLLEHRDGGLAILDYKTDRANTPAEIAAKQAHYAPQLAAYADAVAAVTGRTPAETALVFAKSSGSPDSM